MMDDFEVLGVAVYFLPEQHQQIVDVGHIPLCQLQADGMAESCRREQILESDGSHIKVIAVLHDFEDRVGR